jgi:hypothetical protein
LLLHSGLQKTAALSDTVVADFCVCVWWGEGGGGSLLLSLFYITLFFFPCGGTVIIQKSLCFFLFPAGGIKTEEQIVRCIRKDVNARMDAKGLTSNSILDTVH